jgi:hypothetical protein
MAVPYTFGSATSAIPLSQLDNNFATSITLGNTAIQLGNTVTTLNNMTYANVTINSVNTTFPNSYLTNSAVTIGNTSVSLGSTAATVGGLRIDPRVSSVANTATITPNVAAYDIYATTALATTVTIAAPIGTPVDGDKLIFRLLDNGTTQTVTWNSTYTIIGVTLPTATTANKTSYVGCIYNANGTRWDVVAVTTQA